MQKNNIDTHFADKLKERKINPSISAWERLSIQLDKEHQKKRKKRLFYLSYAASVAVLISIGFFYEGNDTIVNIENTIVEATLDTLKMKGVNLNEIMPIEKAVVKLAKTDVENEVPFKIVKKSTFKNTESIVENVKAFAVRKIVDEEKAPVLEKNGNFLNVKKIQKKKVVSPRIKVNSNDLLFAVTHSQQEVKEYYAKYKIKRKDMLDTIQKELMKSNLKINPETILAEVEYDIEEADFKQNFLQKFKSKMSDVIVAIADRNK